MPPTLHPQPMLAAAALEMGIARITSYGGDGWDYDTVTGLDLEGRIWIMRAARRPDVAPLLLRENAVLPSLNIGLLIPQPEKIGQLANGLPCAAYQYIPAGESSAEVITQCAEKLAKSLHALHSTPSNLWAAFVPQTPSWQERTREQLELTAAEIAWPEVALIKWRELLELDALWSTPPVLCHGDLGPPHLLSLDGQLVGMIDFSDMQCAPASVDFGDLLTAFGKETMLRVLLPYVSLSGGNLEILLAASYGYRQLGPVFTVFHGLNTNQSEFIEEGLIAANEIFSNR